MTRIALGLFILLHGIPFLFESLHPWGLDQWRYIPAGWVWASLAGGMLLLLPPVSALLARPIDRLDGFAMSEKPKVIAFLLSMLFIAASATMFWTFRNATHFLGDGFLWANHLIQDIVFREPVSTWLYRGIYRGLNAARIFGEVNPVMSSAVTSILAGLVFVVFAHKAAKLLYEKRGDHILIIASLLSCGTVMLFFGYIETYPPVAAGVMAFLYFSLRLLHRGGSIVPAVLAFLVTAILHLSAIALLPGLLLLLHFHAGKEVDKRQLRIFLAVVITTGFVALGVLRNPGVFGRFFKDNFLPLFVSTSDQNVGYPVFSLHALFDYANELLLICPPVILLPVLMIARRRQKDKAAENDSSSGRERERMFLALCALFYFLAFAAFNKVIGTSRDWDIFSPLALPLVLWIVLLIRDVFPNRRGEFTVLFLAIIVTHAVPWIALNTDSVRSEERFVDLCDNGYWSKRAKGYGYSTLGQYYRHYGKTLPAIHFYGRAAEQDPKNVKYNYLAGEMYSGLGKHGAALEQYFKVLERDGEHLDALNNTGVSYLELGRQAEAEQYFRRAMDIDPAFASAIQNLGYIYFETERPEELIALHARVSGADPVTAEYLMGMGLTYLERPRNRTAEIFLLHLAEKRPVDIRVTYGLARKYIMDKDYDRAIGMLKRAAEENPADPKVHIDIARVYVAAGDIESAREHAETARSLDPDLPGNLIENIRKEVVNAPAD